jgi:hypothetical protein
LKGPKQPGVKAYDAVVSHINIWSIDFGNTVAANMKSEEKSVRNKALRTGLQHMGKVSVSC